MTIRLTLDRTTPSCSTFATTASAAGGRLEGTTSLGLVGMRERALACGGELSITGRPGGGTTVQLRGATSSGDDDMIRLAIADDHPIVREGLRRIASDDAGIAVAGEAATRAELFRLLAAAAVDVVLLDVSMPGATFVETLRDLKSAAPDGAECSC